jgi:hypothetical protein
MEILPGIDISCFDATHKKSLDLIFEGRKIGFVALHNLLFGLKRGCLFLADGKKRQYSINDYFPGDSQNVFNP